MRIESGSTGERRTRVFIFLLMCAGFAAWFAYDGLVGYPKKNLEWARQALPNRPAGLTADPRVNSPNLKRLENLTARTNGQSPAGMSEQDLINLLGPPAAEQKKELRYVGTEVAAAIRIDDGKVAEIVREVVSPDKAPQAPNFRVRPERLDRLQKGMPESVVRDELGEPHSQQERTLWFVGEAAYASVEVRDGAVVGEPVVRRNAEPSESDIFVQKAIAAGLAVLTLIIGINFVRVLTLRVVLDDEGLAMGSRRVAWDQMTGLKTDEYASKGWVDLLYGAHGVEQKLRLDSYHIDRFQDIIEAICERKGFQPPAPPAPAEEQL